VSGGENRRHDQGRPAIAGRQRLERFGIEVPGYDSEQSSAGNDESDENDARLRTPQEYEKRSCGDEASKSDMCNESPEPF